MNSEDLIGKKFPVKDPKGNIMFWKYIEKVFDLENYPGYGISLDKNSNQLIVITYLEAKDLE